MTDKGYSLTATGSPDIWVAYSVAVVGKVKEETIKYRAPPPSSRDVALGNVDFRSMNIEHTFTRRYDEGTLVLDFYDQRSRRHIFRSTAQAQVEKKLNDANRIVRLNATIDRMLEKIPAK